MRRRSGGNWVPENATAVQSATPLGGLARSLYAAHSLAGNGGVDFSSVLGW